MIVEKVETREKNNSRLLTKEQVAEMLNVPKSRIDKFVFRREIPCFKIGRSIRFYEDEILLWIESCKR